MGGRGEQRKEPTMAEQTTVPAKATGGSLRRRDPFELLEEEMNRFWAQGWPFVGWPFTRRLGEPMAVVPTQTVWAPRVDVFDKNGDLMVKAELPGLKKEDIQVSMDSGDLVITGERKAESEVKEENYYRMERTYGSFIRRLPMPETAQADKIQAKYADGVLEVKIPRAAQAKPEPRNIKVS
jgi:HSP20 family protein